ncbi:MAG: DNA alkylation repair protein [Lachnospiraceae bacterium]|nr:DNA alkylation repair protein [Lachnospiraceae bacterium]
MNVRERLEQLRDEEYREFQSKLVPNISKDVILGVRTPAMRQVAKEFFGTEKGDAFLTELPHALYEENLVHFFMIALIKEFDRCIAETERFLPYIDCWPVSDQSSPKVFSKNHEKLLPYIRKWIDSDHVYTARFGMRMLMNEFLGTDFKTEYLDWVADKKGEDYYLRMMVAWYFATALAKQYDAAVTVIEKRRLDPWTHNKAIQKARESFRVTEKHKAYLKTLQY